MKNNIQTKEGLKMTTKKELSTIKEILENDTGICAITSYYECVDVVKEYLRNNNIGEFVEFTNTKSYNNMVMNHTLQNTDERKCIIMDMQQIGKSLKEEKESTTSELRKTITNSELHEYVNQMIRNAGLCTLNVKNILYIFINSVCSKDVIDSYPSSAEFDHVYDLIYMSNIAFIAYRSDDLNSEPSYSLGLIKHRERNLDSVEAVTIKGV